MNNNLQIENIISTTGFDFITQNQSRIYIDNTGNIGIGLYSPSSNFQVSGDMDITGDLYIESGVNDSLDVTGNLNNVSLQVSGNSIFRSALNITGSINNLSFSGSNFGVSVQAGSLGDLSIEPTGFTGNGIFFSSSDTINFVTAGTTKMTLSNNGIGIGTNPSAGIGLNVNGQIKATSFDGPDKYGYRYYGSLYYTSVGTSVFSKASYPWLRAVRVTCVGGGGGGGGPSATASTATRAGAGGGGGGTSITWILASSLGASENVVVGGGGAGGAGAAGSTGGTSSFGSFCGATGGEGGIISTTTLQYFYAYYGGLGGYGYGGYINFYGGYGGPAVADQQSTANSPNPAGSYHGRRALGGAGGNSSFGGGPPPRTGTTTGTGYAGLYWGSGGGGGFNKESQAAVSGGAGFQGIVIIELFA